MRVTRFILFAAILLQGTACLVSHTADSKPSAQTNDTLKGFFTNPIGTGADPWVIKSGKYYYVCQSRGGGISVRKSDKLTEMGTPKVVWTPQANSWNSKCIWAPELHHIGNKWYIYYAAGQSGPPYIYQRSAVLESETDDPQGKYIEKNRLKTGDDPADASGTIWAIDLTVSKINGSFYAVWSGWEKNRNTDKTSQHLYIAKMDNPWTISSERVKISSPEQPWETGGPLNLNEGPQFLKHNGKIFIIYSTRESWTPEYRLGQLALGDSTKNITDPGNWGKSGPVFQGTPKVLGVGHASFTTSPNGKEWWIFYHSKTSAEPGWSRDLRLQQFTWDSAGNPVFGEPLPAGTPLKKPGGEL